MMPLSGRATTLNAVNLAFVGFEHVGPWTLGSVDGQCFVLIVMTVAAAGVAAGWHLVSACSSTAIRVNIPDVHLLKW